MEETRPPFTRATRGKAGEKKGSSRSVLILLLVTVGLSLVFYLKNVNWGKIKINLKLNFDWLGEIGGSRTVRFETGS